MEFATRALRVGQDLEPGYKTVVQPLYQSATFGWEDLDHIPPVDYTRCANPNRHTIEKVIAALENGQHCVAFSSGMAAIAASLSFLECGDSLLMASDIYGGTYRLCHTLFKKWGIETIEFNSLDPCTLRDAIKPSSKAVIFEGPTNPNLRIPNIQAIAEICKAAGLVSIFDNTFASPALQNPLDLGIDMVVHSTTKYISGHSDVIGGAVVTNSQTTYDELFEYAKTIGSAPSPFDCWLSLRGVKTLAPRVKAHCENAQAVAEFLEADPRVAHVYYPGLQSHPDHELAKKQMRGFGGMVAFEVAASEAAARRVAENTKVFLLAESLGGVESLIAYPPLMSHATMPEEERLARGIPPTLLRLSVGIEDARDLIADLNHALDVAFEGKTPVGKSEAVVLA